MRCVEERPRIGALERGPSIWHAVRDHETNDDGNWLSIVCAETPEDGIVCPGPTVHRRPTCERCKELIPR